MGEQKVFISLAFTLHWRKWVQTAGSQNACQFGGRKGVILGMEGSAIGNWVLHIRNFRPTVRAARQRAAQILKWTQIRLIGRVKRHTRDRRWDLVFARMRWLCNSCSASPITKKPTEQKAHLVLKAVNPLSDRVGINIVGRLPTTWIGSRYVVTMTDYFTWCKKTALIWSGQAVTMANGFVLQCALRWKAPVSSSGTKGRNGSDK